MNTLLYSVTHIVAAAFVLRTVFTLNLLLYNCESFVCN